MYSKILVPCDISYEHSAWLLPCITTAVQIADKFGGRLYFLTIVPEKLLGGYYPDVYLEGALIQAEKQLQKIIKKYVPATSVHELLIKRGSISAEIIRTARELPADLIVMASHGPILKDYLLGSNASHVALHVPCSIMIVRNPKEPAKQ